MLNVELCYIVSLRLTGLDTATPSSMLDKVPTTASASAEVGWRQRVPWPRQGRLYNISNFGDTNACYSDVDVGDERLFFLTLFDNRLSAKYDDLFGAVADRTTDNEDEILQALGQSDSDTYFVDF